MDEYREPVQGVIFEIPKANGESSSAPTTPSASPMKTFSMTNWDTPLEKLPTGMIVDPAPEPKAAPPEIKFQIDNEEVFVPISDEYYIVL